MPGKGIEDILKPVMSALGIDVKKVRIILHISRGIYSRDVSISHPAYLFLPIGAYIVMLEEVEWIESSGRIKFEFVHVTFEMKNSDFNILAVKVGLQDIESGVTKELAEAREKGVGKSVIESLKTTLELLKLNKEVQQKLHELSNMMKK
ncbi:hypothetical protein MUP77_12510 [Candidatus Bathyarchaeota archaeon]|nr:hypothetical protein [Candidatus Bathyarchaeota archaeon]